MNLIDVAYNLIKEDLKVDFMQGKKPIFTFKKIWKLVCQDQKLKGPAAKDKIGNFFTNLMEDPRFVILDKQNWTLREMMRYNDYKKISESMYSIDEEFEEGKIDLEREEKERIALIQSELSNAIDSDDEIVTDTISVTDLLDDDSDDDMVATISDYEDNNEE